MPESRTFTVMCQRQSGKGTIWIDTIELVAEEDGTYPMDQIHAGAIQNCAMAWEVEGEDHDIICIGVILGPVNFLYFDDSHLGD